MLPLSVNCDIAAADDFDEEYDDNEDYGDKGSQCKQLNNLSWAKTLRNLNGWDVKK